MTTIRWAGIAVCAVTLTCVYPGSALQTFHAGRNSSLSSGRVESTQVLNRDSAVHRHPLARLSRDLPDSNLADGYGYALDVPLKTAALALPQGRKATGLLCPSYFSGRAPPAA